jgi:REP element-mobilizing transposase RayT
VVKDGWYHVMGRGVNRGVIFKHVRDRGHFVELLEAMRERFRVRIHAYVEMETHYHLVLQTPEANLSAAMQWLNLSYSAWFNARYDGLGPVFGGRFKSVPVEDGAWAYTLSVYVHLNPLRIAGLEWGKRERQAAGQGMKAPPSAAVVKERLQKLRTYEWSSYPFYAGYARAPKWLTTGPILARASWAGKKGREGYRRYAQALAREGLEEDRLERLCDAVAVGSASFVERVRAFGRKAGREVSGKREYVRRTEWTEIVRAIESVAGAPWERLRAERGGWARPVAMWVARRYGGMTLREVGAAMGGMAIALS